MLYPVAGSRIFIADLPMDPGGVLPADLGAVPSGAFVEIGEAEAIGTLGGTWHMVDLEPTLDRPAGWGAASPPAMSHLKSWLERPVMQIVLGNAPTDPGQALLWAAWRSHDAFPFRIAFPGGVILRSWAALVTELAEVFDTANSVMKVQASLRPVSEILRSEAP